MAMIFWCETLLTVFHPKLQFQINSICYCWCCWFFFSRLSICMCLWWFSLMLHRVLVIDAFNIHHLYALHADYSQREQMNALTWLIDDNFFCLALVMNRMVLVFIHNTRSLATPVLMRNYETNATGNTEIGKIGRVWTRKRWDKARNE